MSARAMNSPRIFSAGSGRLLWRAIAGALILLLLACSSPREAAIARGATVLVLGDSISAGYGLSPEQSWVAHLAPISGWQTINGGVSGDTSAQGLARLPALLEAHRPAAVLIALGGNDMLRKQSMAGLGSNLGSIITLSREAGARPVLVGIPKPSIAGAAFGSLSDHDLYGEVAKRQGVPLIDDAVAEVLSRAEWKLDTLHPNVEGHRELARRVGEQLKSLGLISAR